GVPEYIRRHGNAGDIRLRFGEGGGVEHRGDSGGGEVARVEAGRVARQYLDFDVAFRQVEHEFDQEPVELRLGQRVGALVLDRVHRRRDEERVRQFAGDAVGRDLTLLHRLQQRRLGLRGRAVDLVGEQDV